MSSAEAASWVRQGRPDISLLPADLGFDIRELSVPVMLPVWAQVMLVRFVDKDGQAAQAVGTPEQLARVLRDQGFDVRFTARATDQPAGREDDHHGGP